MAINEHNEKTLRLFLETICPWGAAYADATLGFIGLKKDVGVEIFQAHMILPNGGGVPSGKRIETDNLIAGLFRLADFGMNYEEALQNLSSGSLESPFGNMYIPPDNSGNINSAFFPYPVGFENNQPRITKFQLVGAQGHQQGFSDSALLELRSASTPYESIEELAKDVSITEFQRNTVMVTVTAYNVAAVDLNRKIVDQRASLGLFLAPYLEPGQCSLGYKILANGQVTERQRIAGDKFDWQQMETHWQGSTEIAVPEGAMVQCFASYAGHAQHHGWVTDPNTFPNFLRLLHNALDPNLEKLEKYILDEKHQGKYSRDFEAGIATLLFMAGFSVNPIGGGQSEQNPDLIAATNKGNVIVVECTTGQINQNGKLGKLIERTQTIRSHLQNSAFSHIKVLPVMVTAKSKSSVAELDDAKREGVVVITKEILQEALERTRFPIDADNLFARWWDDMHRDDYNIMFPKK